MKKIITISFLSLVFNFCFAQSWIEINNNPLTPTGRTDNSGFSINGTGYILGGSDAGTYYGTEAWAYDTATKSWSAIAPYPNSGGADGKVTVAIDSLGYAGFGVSGGFTWSSSWYSYNPATNLWTPFVNPFPGAARAYGTAFTVGGEIYVAGGVNGANENGYSDFWKYDPPSATWTFLGHCPALGVNFYPVSFAINGMGYLGTGGAADSITGVTTPQQDFWQYNPVTNTWKQMASFPGGPRMQAIAWATCDKGYVGAGYETHTPQTIDSDFYEFDPAKGPLGTWTRIANYGGGNINGSATFVIGQTGYVCGGQFDSANYNAARGYTWANNDWSYTAIYTPTFSINTPATICAGQSVTFTDTSNYSPEHWSWQFPGATPDTSTAENPTVTYNSVGSYNVIFTAWNDCDSGTHTYTNYITVSTSSVLTINPPVKSLCKGQTVTLYVNATSGTYTWSPVVVPVSLNADTVVVGPGATTIYTVTGSTSVGCPAFGTDTITVVAAPPLIVEPQSPKVCNGQYVTLKAPVSGSNYTWSSSPTLISSGDSATVTPTVTTTYSVTGTDSLGCVATGTDSVYVVTAPPLLIQASLSKVCNGQSVTLYAPVSGTGYTWNSSAAITSSGDSATATPTVTTTYTVTGTDSLGCTVATTDTITVVTAPPLIVEPPSPKVCNGQTVILSVPTSGSDYTWSPSATLSSSTADSVIATPADTTVYTVTGTDSIGCTVVSTDSVYVVTAPPLIIQPQGPQSVCPQQSIALSVPASGKNYQWLPSATLKPDTGDTVLASPLVQTTYTVSGIDSLGCLATSDSEVVSVSNAPNKPTITVLTTGNVLQSSATQGNQWIRNDSILNGATGETYTVTISGWYQVIAENPANGCSTTSDSVYISTTGINQLAARQLAGQLSIYPNPTGGEIFVNINSSAEDVKNWYLQITDVLGRTVYTQLSLNYSNAIDLSNLASGMYFICVMNKAARAVVPVVKN